MYDTSLTRQALPSKRYCYLLGVALSVFISNNGFIIENILKISLERIGAKTGGIYCGTSLYPTRESNYI